MPSTSVLSGKTDRIESSSHPADQVSSLRAIMDNLEGYIWSIDREYRYIIFNSAVEALIKDLLDRQIQPGDKMLEILGMVDASHPEQWSRFYSAGFKGEKQWFVAIFNIGERQVYYEVSMNPIYENNLVTGLSCFARDISNDVINERKHTHSEFRFRSLIENSSDFIVVLDNEGRIIYVSPSLTKQFGLGAGEFMGITALDFVHPDDLPEISEKFVDLLQNPGKTITFKSRAQTKEGVRIWVEGMVSNLLHQPGVNGIVCNFRDVTDRASKEMIIRQSELKFRSLIENSADLIMMADAGGNFTYGSPSVERLLGYSEKEYIGKFCLMLVHPNSIPAARELLGEIFKYPGKLFTLNLTLAHKNGEEIWVEGMATNMLDVPGVNALVANFRDITERKKAETKIKESEELYRNMFNNCPFTAMVCDSRSLQVLEVNEAAVQSYGYSRKEFLQMNVFGLAHIDEQRHLAALFTEKEELVKTSVRKHVNKSRQSITVEMMVHTINYKGRKAFLVLCNDITEKLLLQDQLLQEKIRRQQEISRATIEAQEKERETIGRDLHDNVNQVLTTARLFLSCIHTEDEACNDLIQRSNRNITTAIEDIRRLSKSMIQTFRKEVGLQLSIEDLADNIRLTTNSEVDMYYAVSDESQLDDKLKLTIYRIIQEQTNNIIKHAEASSISISIVQSFNQLQLFISDNGKGFDMQQQREGIGISNIFNRAELFNGQVNMEAAPGEGCSLEILFILPTA